MANHRFTGRVQFADAESVAIDVLGFIAGEPARLMRFLSLTGLEPETVRAAAADPGFLASVLDYVSADESLLLACAQTTGHKPEALVAARQALSPSASDP